MFLAKLTVSGQNLLCDHPCRSLQRVHEEPRQPHHAGKENLTARIRKITAAQLARSCACDVSFSIEHRDVNFYTCVTIEKSTRSLREEILIT